MRDETGKFLEGNSFGFTPGRSGNPSGRPRGSKSGTAALRRLITQFVDAKSGLSAEELIASKLIAKACEGDLAAIKEVYDRLEGRPGQRIELETEIMDWRERAMAYGISENEAIEQAKLLLGESDNGSGSADANSEA